SASASSSLAGGWASCSSRCRKYFPSPVITSSWASSSARTPAYSGPRGRLQVGHVPSGPSFTIWSRCSFTSSYSLSSSVRFVSAYCRSRTHAVRSCSAARSTVSRRTCSPRAAASARARASATSPSSVRRRSSIRTARASSASCASSARGEGRAVREAGLETPHLRRHGVADFAHPLLRLAQALVAEHARQERRPLGLPERRHHRQLLLAGEVGVEELIVSHSQRALELVGDRLEGIRDHLAVLVERRGGEPARHAVLVG